MRIFIIVFVVIFSIVLLLLCRRKTVDLLSRIIVVMLPFGLISIKFLILALFGLLQLPLIVPDLIYAAFAFYVVALIGNQRGTSVNPDCQTEEELVRENLLLFIFTGWHLVLYAVNIWAWMVDKDLLVRISISLTAGCSSLYSIYEIMKPYPARKENQ